jgi:hypothetical protein
MRHPFDGLVTPVSPSRRSWLAALAALGGLVFGSRLFAAAPPPAGTGKKSDPEPKKKPSTRAKREEGVSTEKLNEEGATKALNEQGGPTTKALREEGAFTRALNENGGPRMTTLALNEEGAKK